MIKAIKIYTGDDGHTHVVHGSVLEDHLTHAASIRFKETPPHSFYDWHPAPTIQYVITLLGTLEFETHSGEKFIIQPGDVLIAMDTTGSGHKWHLTDDNPWRRAYIVFDETKEINFIEVA
jgi:quercetin dioxygenase-like cupin family protein